MQVCFRFYFLLATVEESFDLLSEIAFAQPPYVTVQKQIVLLVLRAHMASVKRTRGRYCVCLNRAGRYCLAELRYNIVFSTKLTVGGACFYNL